MRVEVFPFQTPDGSRFALGTVRTVDKDRNFMSGESVWYVHVQLDAGGSVRCGGYYRDDRVEVYR